MNTMLDYSIEAFSNAPEWRTWLEHNYAATEGIWLRIYKKDSGIATVTYAEALNQALCFGWIDGQKKRYDELSFLQKFTPRRSRSLWSKRNIEHVERLTALGLMTPAGQSEIERAKVDGRWQAAYDAPSQMKVPDDFITEVSKNPTALKFYESLNKTNRYAIAWRLQTAKKPETRQRRMESIITMLAEQKKFY